MAFIAGIKVIAAAKEAAQRDNLTPAVITFDPHPREFFRQDDSPFHLADRQEKTDCSPICLARVRRQSYPCAL